jgi:hypothetical protein
VCALACLQRRDQGHWQPVRIYEPPRSQGMPMLIDIMCIQKKLKLERLRTHLGGVSANTPMTSHSQNLPQRSAFSSSARLWQGPYDARTQSYDGRTQSDHEARSFSAHESAHEKTTTRMALKPSPIWQASNEQPSRAYVTSPQNFKHQHVSPQKMNGPVTLKTMVDVPVDEHPSPSSRDSPHSPAVAKKSPTAQQTDR